MHERIKLIDLSPSAVVSLKEKATHTDSYAFLDAGVLIKSDSRSVMEFFRQAYRRFRTTAPLDDEGDFAYHVITDEADSRGPLLLHSDGRAYSLVRGEALPDSADVVIFSSILKKIRSHLLVHGSAVSRRGEALVFSGLTGSGKTTLALELTRRGCKFFSDEIAAFSRSNHSIHPFPRAIGTRESTLALLETVDFEAGRLRSTLGGEKKWMVDVEDIFGPSLSEACRGKYLFLLETALDEGGSPKKAYHNIDIAMKAVDDEFLRSLCATEGVECLNDSSGGTFHTITVRVRKEKSTQQSFLEVCRRFEDLILYKVKAVERPPNPGQEPAYFPVSHMDAGLELLGNLQNMIETDGWMSGDSSGGTSGILFELLGAISDMECYRLLVGNLKETADLIIGLVETGDC